MGRCGFPRLEGDGSARELVRIGPYSDSGQVAVYAVPSCSTTAIAVCGVGFSPKTTLTSTPCADGVCTTTGCCTVNPVCSAGVCTAAGFSLVTPLSIAPCKLATCSTSECCIVTCAYLYDLVPGVLSWTAAAARARRGYLADITSAEENAFVCALKEGGSVWLGMNDDASDGNWVFTNGPLNGTAVGPYENWLSGEPNNFGGQEGYGEMQVECTWNDVANISPTDIQGFVVQYGRIVGEGACPVVYATGAPVQCAGRFCTVSECCVQNRFIGMPLGLADFSFPANRITTSSISGNCATNWARLNTTSVVSCGSVETPPAWCSDTVDLQEYLQFAFVQPTLVTGIQTQGRNAKFPAYSPVGQYVTSYKVSFSTDGGVFTVYTQNGTEVLFLGNADTDSIVTQHMTMSTPVSFMRILPQSWVGHMSMRAEVFVQTLCSVAACRAGFTPVSLLPSTPCAGAVCTETECCIASPSPTTCASTPYLYELVPCALDWDAAAASATARGGHLATITNAEENAFVCALKGSSRVWLGMSDAASESNWVYTGGPLKDTPIGPYVNWLIGEPSNVISEED